MVNVHVMFSCRASVFIDTAQRVSLRDGLHNELRSLSLSIARFLTVLSPEFLHMSEASY